MLTATDSVTGTAVLAGGAAEDVAQRDGSVLGACNGSVPGAARRSSALASRLASVACSSSDFGVTRVAKVSWRHGRT
jgi:hypothetical protein